ncbi:unnamed protein product [Parajaminaea phylloscopi]
MALLPVASAQVEALDPPTVLPTAFHPSIGLPEQSVGYVQCPLFGVQAGKTEDSDGVEADEAAEATTSVPASMRPVDPATSFTLTTTIPPASIPLIFAHRQWRAGLILADLIAHASSQAKVEAHGTSPFDVSQLNVLELGCGTGIPGMIAAKLGRAALSLVTDYDSPPLISTLSANLRRNFSAEEIKSKVRASGYSWGSDTGDIEDIVEAMLREKRRTDTNPRGHGGSDRDFDRLLLADCLWDALSHADLLKSLTKLLKRTSIAETRPPPCILIVSGLHTGRDKLTGFIRRAARHGLVLIDVDPGPTPRRIFPLLSPAEEEEVRVQRGRMSPDDALYNAAHWIYELELAVDEDPVGDEHPRTSSPADRTVPPDGSNKPHTIDTGRRARLTGRRRAFVIEERPEERKEVGGVHRRNRWITIWGLAWQR